MSTKSMDGEVGKVANKGKRKISIEPIINKTKKQVTFSKRRNGLFKKGAELCSLCGAEVAIVTFSGAGKVFSFGHPNVDEVIHRYINSNKPSCDDNNDRDDNNSKIVVGECSHQYKDVLGQIDAEKKANISMNNWWDENIENLGLVELEQFKVGLENLRNEVAVKIEGINRNSMSLVPQNYNFGSRDGNIVAHNQQSLNSPTYWMDHGMTNNNYNYQVSSAPMESRAPIESSFCDLLMRR